MSQEEQPLTNTNQTQFAQEEPLFETQTILDLDENGNPKVKKKFYKTKKGIALIIFSIIFSLFILLLLSPGKKQQVVIVEEEQIEEEIKMTVGPLEEKIILMQRDLTNADPNKHELPFPPVDMRIGIDKQE